MYGQPQNRPQATVENRTIENVPVQILTHRHCRRRPPKPHEMARNLSRGRPAFMMHEDIEEEYRVLYRRRLLGCIRQHPNGSFFFGRFVSFDFNEIVRGMMITLGIIHPDPRNVGKGTGTDPA